MRGGDRVRVLLPSGPDVPERWSEQGVEARSFRYAPRRLEVLGYGRSLRADEATRLLALLVTPAYLLAARRQLGRELASGSWDLVQAHWVVPNGLAARVAARRVPLAIGLHGSDVFLAERPLVRSAVRRVLRRTSVMTACSPELAERVERLGLAAGRTHVIPYGVDIELFRPRASGEDDPGGWRQRLGIPAAAPIALGVGRMATKKGFHRLIAILPQLRAAAPEAHLVLAGGGDRLEEFRRGAAEAWPGHVHFPGPVLHDTLPALYRAADLFVLPAVHDRGGNVDGLPNVILEAMASGLPVVASAISGIPLAVEEGVTGRLVGEQDDAALAAALGELLGGAGLRGAMGEAGRRRAERELTWDAVAARYRAAYRAALSGRA